MCKSQTTTHPCPVQFPFPITCAKHPKSFKRSISVHVQYFRPLYKWPVPRQTIPMTVMHISSYSSADFSSMNLQSIPHLLALLLINLRLLQLRKSSIERLRKRKRRLGLGHERTPIHTCRSFMSGYVVARDFAPEASLLLPCGQLLWYSPVILRQSIWRGGSRL
jgi:hypothetical protein